ncbi:hypothetical protein CEF07_00950 [Chlamydia abortus]|nr:hypothetical protein CEF07_00950 [Chlamydia abortus]
MSVQSGSVLFNIFRFKNVNLSRYEVSSTMLLGGSNFLNYFQMFYIPKKMQKLLGYYFGLRGGLAAIVQS